MIRILILWIFVAPFAFGSQITSYQEGRAYTEELHHGVKEMALKKGNVENVPGFTLQNLPQTHLDKQGNFNEEIAQSLNQNEAGNFVVETSKSRARFKIDPETDPLFKIENQENSEDGFEIQNNEDQKQGEQWIEKRCEEGGEAITSQCHETAEVQVKSETKQVIFFTRYPNLIKKVLVGIQPDSDAHTGQLYIPPYLWGTFWNVHSMMTQGSNPNSLHYFKSNICPLILQSKNLMDNCYLSLDCNNVQRYWIQDHADNTPDLIYTDHSQRQFYGWIRIGIEYKVNEITIDHWLSDCQGLDALVDEGICYYQDRVCREGAETRHINGYPIYKDCWKYEQQYQCKMIKDDCSALRAQGCYQTESYCKEKKGDRCWIYEQRYQCPQQMNAQSKVKSKALDAFCLTGDCHNTSYQTNGEMLDVISRLSLLKEIQDDIRLQGNGNFKIFKGLSRECSRGCLNFKDCCGGLKGWGVSLNMADCKAEEKELAALRKKNLCHQIGTFCSKKVLGKCVSKKTSFCCFTSQFGRLLQVQGRPQLGLGWGTAEQPDCRGLTVEELSKMDLSKFDFKEVFEEMMRKYHEPNLKTLQLNTHEKIQENIKQMEQGLKQKSGDGGGIISDQKKHL